MWRVAVFSSILVVSFGLLGIGNTFEFFPTGECSVAFFNNLTGQAVDGLLLRFSDPVPDLRAIAVGGHMVPAAETAGGVLLGGSLLPGGTCEVNWCSEPYPLESAAWLLMGEVIEEIDVHVPTARLVWRRSAHDPELVDLRAIGSSDPDGLPLVEFLWDLGDGQTASGVAVEYSLPSHESSRVTLTVVDSEGKAASREQRIKSARVVEEPATCGFAGQQIAFVRLVEYSHDILIVGLDGANLTSLTNGIGSNVWIQWSPDGTAVAFISNREGATNLFLQTLCGDEVERLTEEFAHSHHWGEDGNIVLSTVSSLQLLDPATKASTLIAEGGTYSYPRLSPNGTQVVVRTAHNNLTLMSIAGDVLGDIGGSGSGRWSPNGRYVSVHTHYGIRVYDTYTSTILPGFDSIRHREIISSVMWSPDGSQLAYAFLGSDTEQEGIEAVDMAGNLTLHVEGETHGFFGWSPDGKYLLTSALEGTDKHRPLAVLDTTTLETRIIVDDMRPYHGGEWQP